MYWTPLRFGFAGRVPRRRSGMTIKKRKRIIVVYLCAIVTVVES